MPIHSIDSGFKRDAREKWGKVFWNFLRIKNIGRVIWKGIVSIASEMIERINFKLGID